MRTPGPDKDLVIVSTEKGCGILVAPARQVKGGGLHRDLKPSNVQVRPFAFDCRENCRECLLGEACMDLETT